MKNSRSIFIFFFFVLFGFGFLMAQDQHPPGPIISFQSKTYDFDTIPYAGDGRGVYHFTNTGLDTLHILVVKSSCGCLVASWDKKPVPPGESGEVRFQYLTRRVGPINKSMTVVSDALNEPRLTLRVLGYVLPQKRED